MKFDWYQSTIEDTPQAVLFQVAKLGHEVRQADGAAKRWRYRQGWAIHHNQRGVVAHVFAGGNGDKPHALATGEDAQAFAEVLRDNWPDRHLVTRADAAEDFIESGAFVRLRRVARRVAKAHRLAFPRIEDVLNKCAGRTQYIGGASSDYRARIYEKGWEQVGKMLVSSKLDGRLDPQSVSRITNEATGEHVRPEDWTRQELQARPRQEEARRLAATLSPEQLWGCTPWALELARDTMALDLERVIMRTKKISKDEEALRWMCQQYGAMLSRLQADLGDWSCVGLQIGDIIKRQIKA